MQRGRTLAIIPCHNEQVAIGSIVLRARRHVDEVLVIDDGCTDETVDIATQAGAQVVSHTKNKGKSASIRSGFSYALGKGFDHVVTLDGDGQHNPDEIPRLLEPLVKGDADVSVGFRVGKGTEMPFWRKMGKRCLDYATSVGNGGFVTDSQCGFRGFNRRALEAIGPRLYGEEFVVESEQLLRAHEHNLKVTNVHITCKYRDLKTSTKNPASHGASVLNQVVTLVALERPLIFIGIPGIVLVAAGLFYGLGAMQTYTQTRLYDSSQFLLVGLSLIVGIVALFVGVVLTMLPGIIKRTRTEG